MLSTFLLYAAGGYFGTPAFNSKLSNWASKIQFDDDGWGPNPGPDDGPLPKFRLPKFPKIKWPPPPPPDWMLTIAGLIGGLIGGFAVNAGFAENPVLALFGSMIGGRVAFDIVNAFNSSTAKTL